MSIPYEYVYTPSTTDVTIRWRIKYGWTPPTEQEHFKKKWADFRTQAARGIESLAPEEDPLNEPQNVNIRRITEWKTK